MGNIFNIPILASTIATAKDKAIAFAGQYGLNNALAGHVLPPIPPYPVGGASFVDDAAAFDLEAIEQVSQDRTEYSIFGTPMCFPFSIKLRDDSESSWWLLPVEPIISIGGGNILIRRNVAKVSTSKTKSLRGSIKERWAQDDYTINIDGLLTKFDAWDYPQDDVARLRRILEAKQPIDVKCQLLEVLGIGRIAVEKFDFPFTKSEENQVYTITAYSDDDWDLFIKLNAD